MVRGLQDDRETKQPGPRHKTTTSPTHYWTGGRLPLTHGKPFDTLFTRWCRFPAVILSAHAQGYEMDHLASKSHQIWGGHFPRLFELYRESDQTAPGNWFLQPGINRALIAEEPILRRIEEDLQQLDSLAWTAFKSKASRYVHLLDAWGYSRQLFDCLHEVKGYLSLKHDGYEIIEFIPEKKDTFTPDLRARLGRSVAVMEVKSVNESDAQKDYLAAPIEEHEFVEIDLHLPEAFMRKLHSTLDHACVQLLAITDPSARRIVYFAIRADFNFDAHAEIADFLRAHAPPGVEIIVHFVPDDRW